MHADRQTDRYGQMDRRTDRHIHTYNTFNTYIDTLLLLLLDFALIYFNLLYMSFHYIHTYMQINKQEANSQKYHYDL